ncbi:sensory rhodopsin transducer [Deinococcus sp.]|uniref:sensory rhodopsin transducer n=1 Tax=Deinococcus sp. TaxID=47478 RepID=UPI003B590DD2
MSSNSAIGKTVWAIPEGWIPGWIPGPEPEMRSHEVACILSPTDREPAGPYPLTVGARRTLHQRNTLTDPEPRPVISASTK